MHCLDELQQILVPASLHSFDDIRDRKKRVESDNFGIVRDLFNDINKQLKQHYKPSDSLCIDEQLLKFRGRIKFKQFIPSKPAKYGLKTWASVDVDSMYTCVLEPYVGNQRAFYVYGNANPLVVSTAPFDLVLRFSKDYVRCGRNNQILMLLIGLKTNLIDKVTITGEMYLSVLLDPFLKDAVIFKKRLSRLSIEPFELIQRFLEKFDICDSVPVQVPVSETQQET